MGRIKDTDYLSISTRIRAMESRMVTRERMERMLEARSDDDAIKVLSECGYEDIPTITHHGLDRMVGHARSALYRDLKGSVPQPALVEIFQMKYDYHNAKVLLKAEAMGSDSDRLLMAGGRWSADTVRDAFRRDSLRDFTPDFRRAVEHARESLSAGGDPQISDFVLDRAYFEEMLAAANSTGSEFLVGYVRLLIDATNLRSGVRAARMGKGSDFLMQVLVPGGNVEPRTVADRKGGELAAPFRTGMLAEAAALADGLAGHGSGELTSFERLCDNGVMHYLAQAKLIPFGVQAVVSYLYARESEFTAIRTILSGRMAGLSSEIIRERLREAYV